MRFWNYNIRRFPGALLFQFFKDNFNRALIYMLGFLFVQLMPHKTRINDDFLWLGHVEKQSKNMWKSSLTVKQEIK